MVQESLLALEMLAEEGINVSLVNISTLKPIDRDIIIEMASSHKFITTAEDHNCIGGLGDAVGEVLLPVLTPERVLSGPLPAGGRVWNVY